MRAPIPPRHLRRFLRRTTAWGVQHDHLPPLRHAPGLRRLRAHARRHDRAAHRAANRRARRLQPVHRLARDGLLRAGGHRRRCRVASAGAEVTHGPDLAAGRGSNAGPGPAPRVSAKPRRPLLLLVALLQAAREEPMTVRELAKDLRYSVCVLQMRARALHEAGCCTSPHGDRPLLWGTSVARYAFGPGVDRRGRSVSGRHTAAYQRRTTSGARRPNCWTEGPPDAIVHGKTQGQRQASQAGTGYHLRARALHAASHRKVSGDGRRRAGARETSAARWRHKAVETGTAFGGRITMDLPGTPSTNSKPGA